MKIELNREDILKEIDENYRNDANFFVEIIDNSSTSWEPIREVVIELVKKLKLNNELGDVANILRD
jgi:hypothetical protein